jgi:hypothetical protein
LFGRSTRVVRNRTSQGNDANAAPTPAATAELRKRSARARLQKIAGIPRALMAAYIRSPTTLRTHTIRADEKTAVPRSAR